MTPLLHLQSDYLYFTGVRLSNPGHITVAKGITTVIGANGSGKSTLGNIIERGRNFRTNRISAAEGQSLSVKKIEFSDIHSLSGMHVEYYQQRYEATMNDEVPTVAEIMGENFGSDRWLQLTRMFRLTDAGPKRVNFLSSGELRKLLIINALMTPVDLLILDNPYIGLDAASRETLDEAIEALSHAGMSVMMLIANPDDIHPHSAQIIPLREMKILEPITEFESFADVKRLLTLLFDYAINVDDIPLPPRRDNETLDSVLKIENCAVDYGSRRLITDLSWEVSDCQCWALSGPNGSGKSTLLSLICADNPKAYSNNISLFGRRRGSGESIWDIKSRIAYISPEMSLHFHPAGNVASIIAQGLNDTTGVFIRLKPGQMELARRWMSILHIEHLVDRQFNTLSSGERQMVMLARTFIKQPRLMILDEPLHGLDWARNRAVRAIINYFAARAAAKPDMFPMSIIFVTHYLRDMPECIKFTKTL